MIRDGESRELLNHEWSIKKQMQTKCFRALIFGGVCAILFSSFSDLISQEDVTAPESTQKLIRADNESLPAEYRLGFRDVIEMKFLNNERFNDIVTVRPDGRITIQRVGDIYVIGMTPTKLDSIITAVYAKYLKDPEISVIIREFGGYQYYVLGEVVRPGEFLLQHNTTVLEALAAAGGPNEIANLSNVLLLRPEANEVINATKINLKSYMSVGKNHISDSVFHLQPKDVVYVPKTAIANVKLFLTQIYDSTLPPLEVYLRALWWNDR